MERVLRGYVIFVTVLFTNLTSTETNATTPIEEVIIQGVEYSDSLIQDVKVTYTVKTVRDDNFLPIVSKVIERDASAYKYGIEKATWAKKGAMEYLERKNYISSSGDFKDLLQHYITAFNGEVWKYYYPVVSGNLIARGTIFPNSQEPGMFTPAALSFMDNFDGKSLAQILRQGTFTIDNSMHEIAGQQCYKIIAKDGNHKFTVYIDTERGFRPLKIESYSGVAISPSVVYDSIQLRDFGNGLWFPVKGIKRFFWGKPEERLEASTEELNVEEIYVNSGIPDTLFQITFPSGTRIYDHILQGGYIVGGIIN